MRHLVLHPNQFELDLQRSVALHRCSTGQHTVPHHSHGPHVASVPVDSLLGVDPTKHFWRGEQDSALSVVDNAIRDLLGRVEVTQSHVDRTAVVVRVLLVQPLLCAPPRQGIVDQYVFGLNVLVDNAFLMNHCECTE